MRRKDRLISVAIAVLMMSILAGCGSDGSKSGKTTSTVKNVNDVLEEQMAENDDEDLEDDSENADGSDVAIENNGDDSSSSTSEIDAVNEKLEEAGKAAGKTASDGIDVDLTKLSSTMVYSEVYNMMSEPDKYYGKTIRMEGTTSIYHDETDGNDYYACVIKDATECCAQGIEFVLNDGKYPEANSQVTVTGTFSSYKIGDYEYYTLVDAKME